MCKKQQVLPKDTHKKIVNNYTDSLSKTFFNQCERFIHIHLFGLRKHRRLRRWTRLFFNKWILIATVSILLKTCYFQSARWPFGYKTCKHSNIKSTHKYNNLKKETNMFLRESISLEPRYYICANANTPVVIINQIFTR